jgi:hypothetical protein
MAFSSDIPNSLVYQREVQEIDAIFEQGKPSPRRAKTDSVDGQSCEVTQNPTHRWKGLSLLKQGFTLRLYVLLDGFVL